MSIILIGDQRVKQMEVRENNDPFVDLAREFSELAFDEDRLFVQKRGKSISIARRSVGEMLVKAQSFLPPDVKLLVKECYRPLWIQKENFDSYCNQLKTRFPEWSEQKIYDECCRLNAPIEVAPHSTGGAVDLTLIDLFGNWLPMGTEFNAEPLETDNATYTYANNISDEAKANRKILVAAMEKAGFVNYPTEWWHWSFGDKYWALIKKQPYALFSSEEDFPKTVQIRIDKSNWLTTSFARCRGLFDILREPHAFFHLLSDNHKDKFRQTQVEKNEVVKILGHYKNFALIQKRDQTIGWLLNVHFFDDPSVKNFPKSTHSPTTPEAFFDHWVGCRYVWGGVSRKGIDCSGFTQRYYQDVLGLMLPKNSKDQKKSGYSKNLSEIRDHDLVFCYRIGGRGIHHVGLFFQGDVWHAQLERGVIKQSLSEFMEMYNIESVCCYLNAEKTRELIDGYDYYIENGLMVFTERYHLKKGYCCQNGCRHCPW